MSKIILTCNRPPQFDEKDVNPFVRSRIYYGVKDGEVVEVTLSITGCGDKLGPVHTSTRKITESNELADILERYPELKEKLD